ncbi:hypothetical protein C0J08_13790 [Marinomonas sp. CT5]|uniref:DUF6151 family protein n=1 Tax=Marinomonas sp. CT5 TaxID=2066133 RepID=UPI001BB03E4C|nr:DUF6151 family protein [Marinomonas sp. CT5]QUX96403.1 hypothetical protein C0J08_13790 [Marinomonas sp. CT5]
MAEVNLRCACGTVQGKISSSSSKIGTRIICCCNDCQAFAYFLRQKENILDQYGGTDIFQIPMSFLTITEGKSQIACVRLSSKGLYRWHTSCCNTPIGNTFGGGGSFIGVIHNFMDNTETRDADLGKSRGYVFSQFATPPVPQPLKASSIKINFRMVTKILTWKLKGFSKPSAFFNNIGEPICEPQVLEKKHPKI